MHAMHITEGRQCIGASATGDLSQDPMEARMKTTKRWLSMVSIACVAASVLAACSDEETSATGATATSSQTGSGAGGSGPGDGGTGAGAAGAETGGGGSTA